MGLDMYLEGEKFLWTNWKHPEKNITEDGFKVKTKTLELGYWRKHPNLHGFIVNTFNKGKDDCEKIEMTDEDIIKTIDAIKSKNLPPTLGFFFGASDGSEDEESIKIFEKALEWLETKEQGVIRSIYYQASW